MKPQKISWAVLLPISEIVLWSALVLMPTLFLCGEFYLLQKYEKPRQVLDSPGWLSLRTGYSGLRLRPYASGDSIAL